MNIKPNNVLAVRTKSLFRFEEQNPGSYRTDPTSFTVRTITTRTRIDDGIAARTTDPTTFTIRTNTGTKNVVLQTTDPNTGVINVARTTHPTTTIIRTHGHTRIL